MDHNGAEKLFQQDHQYQAEDTKQTAFRPSPGSLEPDPRLLHKPGDNKPHHLSGMALPAGTIRLSRIQGRYTQAVSFTSGVITMQK
jgi:hypothetical protein